MSSMIVASFLAGCNGGVEEELPQEDDSGPSPEVTGVRYSDSITVPGEIQTLFSAGDDLWAISRFAGQFNDPGRLDVQKIVGDSYQTVVSLPHADQRSYGWAGSVQIGGEELIAALYSSNTAFSPQDGTHHGVVFFDTDGNLIADHELYATHGITGPSGFALDPETQNIYVLVNNSGNVGDPDDTVNFGSSAIIEITDPYNPSSNDRKFSLDGFKNASAIAFRDGQLIVAAAENTLDQTAGPARILTIDPVSGSIDVNPVSLPSGLGINGNMPSSDDGELVITGNNESEGRSLALLNPDNTVTVYSVPEGFQPYVPNAQPVGSNFLFNVAQGFGVQTVLMDGEEGTFELLETVDAQFGVAPVFVGAGTYCDAAVGTDIGADGTLLPSTITCYQAVSE